MMIINYITWVFDPQAFSLFGLEIRWYGVMFALAFALDYVIGTRMFKMEKQHPNLIDTLLYAIALGTIVGARLGHCFFYEPSFYLAHPIEIFYIRDGGLASHGAAICIPLAIAWVARHYKLSFWYLMDRMVILVAFAGFFIRMGNLFNSEIYGHATTLPWGFIFANNGETLAKHPTQLYEAFSYLAIFIGLLWYYLRHQRKPKEGIILGWFFVLLFGARFVIEHVKEVQEAWEANYLLNMGQILSIPFILLGVAVLVLVHYHKLPFQLKAKAPAPHSNTKKK